MGFKEAFYNVDLSDGYLEGDYSHNAKQVYNTATNTRAYLNNDMDWKNPPQILADSKVLIPEDSSDRTDYLDFRQKWVSNNMPPFVTIGIIFDMMSDEIKMKTLKYLEKEVNRNLHLQELTIWVLSKQNKENIEEFFAPIKDLCDKGHTRKPIEFEIINEPYLDFDDGSCSLKDLDGAERKWHLVSCPFESRRNVIINSDGALYRCIKYINTPYHRVGNLDNGYPDLDTIIHKQCKSCKMLPLCTGGCIGQKDTRASKKLCESTKEWLKEIVNEEKAG